MIILKDICRFCGNKTNPMEFYCSEDCEENFLFKQDEADKKGLCIWCFVNKQFGKLASCKDCWNEIQDVVRIVDNQLDKWRLESNDKR